MCLFIFASEIGSSASKAEISGYKFFTFRKKYQTNEQIIKYLGLFIFQLEAQVLQIDKLGGDFQICTEHKIKELHSKETFLHPLFFLEMRVQTILDFICSFLCTVSHGKASVQGIQEVIPVEILIFAPLVLADVLVRYSEIADGGVENFTLSHVHLDMDFSHVEIRSIKRLPLDYVVHASLSHFQQKVKLEKCHLIRVETCQTSSDPIQK